LKRLLVNADDFGFTRDVNAGIIEAHQNGILTAATLMANGGAFDDAVALARANPSLDVGVHFVLTGGQSLLTGKPLPASVPALVRGVYAGELNLYDELAAQAQKVRDAGIVAIHADTHKHTHLLQPVRRALLTVAEDFDIRWIRRPADFDGTGLLSAVMRRMIAGLSGEARTTDHFAGFGLTGRLETKNLVALLARLPEGSTELMTHPGRCAEELKSAPTRLKESRARELAALTAAETRTAIAAYSIILTSYRDL
jgi:chitin disaccharide deacetylase